MLPCENGVKDGAETDVDCGGSCLPCSVGRICSVANDCSSQKCAGSRCVECVFTQDCGGGAACEGGRCLAVCASDAECAGSEVCSQGLCVARSGGCMSDSDCTDPARSRCEPGRDVCVACYADAHCPAGKICSNFACTAPPPECASNIDCSDHPIGSLCLTSTRRCVECLRDLDCFDGKRCLDNACAFPPACQSDGDCPGGCCDVLNGLCTTDCL